MARVGSTITATLDPGETVDYVYRTREKDAARAEFGGTSDKRIEWADPENEPSGPYIRAAGAYIYLEGG